MLFFQRKDEAAKQLERLILENLEKVPHERKLQAQEIGTLLDQLAAQGKQEAYFAPLIPIIQKKAGAYPAEILRYVTNHITEYPYSVGYYRRPFRTRNPRVHIDSVMRKLYALYDLSKLNFSLLTYLTSPEQKPTDSSIIPYILAYELDCNNTEILNALKDILYGDNNTALLNRAMIRGMVLCHQADVHHMLGQMLIAARLQEGLRQSIVEAMDEGTMEAFASLLKVIIEHDFIRYSSVVRALDVWTGLALEAANTRIVKQGIDYAYRCISDESLCHEWAKDNDVQKLYFALWATAVREEERLPELLKHIMDQGATYQQIAAQYFLIQSQNDELRFSLSAPYLAQSNLELQSLVLTNYVYGWSRAWRSHPDYEELLNKPIVDRVPLLEPKEERVRQFELLRTMLLQMPKAEMVEQSQVFEWRTYTHSTDTIANKMLYLSAYDLDPALIAQVIALKDRVSPNLRSAIIQSFTQDVSNPILRQYLFDSLSDKSVSNREAALARIGEMALTPQDVELVQGLLKLKTGALRQSAIKILLKQDLEQLDHAIETLVESPLELQRLGALEMLCILKEDEKRGAQFDRVKRHIATIGEPTSKEQPLVERLGQKEPKGLHNGFGLFDPAKEQALYPLPDDDGGSVKSMLNLSFTAIQRFLRSLSDEIHVHRDYEYTVERYAGHKESYLLGARLERLQGYYKQEQEQSHLEGYPLAEVWKGYWEASGCSARDLVQVMFYFASDSLYKYSSDQLTGWESHRYTGLGDWGKAFVTELYPMKTFRAFAEWLPTLPYIQQVRQLVFAYFHDSEQEERFAISSQILNKIIRALQKRELEDNSKAWALLSGPWLAWAGSSVYDDRSFLAYFAMKLNLDRLTQYEEFHPELGEFVRALDLGLIDDDEVYKELLTRKRSRRHITTITGTRVDFVKEHPTMGRFKERVLSVILELELNRGDLPTEVSDLAMGINRYEGMADFIAILSGLDQESFVRGYIYGSRTKKEALSHLLRVCHPAEGDDVKKLAGMLKGTKIADKRLLEAAMYAPQWLELVAEHLNWNGLRSAAWYFHAHVNESFSAEKETIVAHYSPISPVDFNDGAFDIRWFRDAYVELGEERFNVLYQCAKYISAGANHRRSQLFADSVLGKLDLAEIRASVESKRNKDHLLSYSLIPISGEDRDRDVLERYEVIQLFLKESKSFGAQRSASEAKASAIALDNLSRNAGYPDVIRLKWEMEARKMEEVLHLLEPMAIEEIEVKLAIDENGRAEIAVAKNGKPLKSLPSKYNKHPYVTALKETVSSLRDQFKRARAEFEKCMEAESSFTYTELANLMKNPTIAPLLRTLVFKMGSSFGFYADGALLGETGEAVSLEGADAIYIAHPLHLYESGAWSRYQKLLFDRQLKQPFKQVFRELYLPNSDELASGAVSRRYAGHQIQPKRAAALLKTRLWTVSYEEGLQKVYHKENIIAQVYALADWFSPSEVEAPTLETVSFMDRKTYQPIELSRIPGIIFSEVMRDVDLVVSTAHAGGVDPEASLTTIELRKAIVTESLRLLKISNVRLEGNFARITGALGEYGVHLGSGTVQKQAVGTLYILPVQSQYRGRLFLPFMDEDPKTAEILSKIVLLAQDTKIKDPQILEQLRAGAFV